MTSSQIIVGFGRTLIRSALQRTRRMVTEVATALRRAARLLSKVDPWAISG